MGHHEHHMNLGSVFHYGDVTLSQQKVATPQPCGRAAGKLMTNGIAKHYRRPPRVGDYKVKLVDMSCRIQPKKFDSW